MFRQRDCRRKNRRQSSCIAEESDNKKRTAVERSHRLFFARKAEKYLVDKRKTYGIMPYGESPSEYFIKSG